MIEPSAKTRREIGRLCAAWSLLEARSEATLWGIIGADQRLGPLISARLDLRGRWQMIIDQARRYKYHEDDLRILRQINADLTPIIQDRNIVIHGLIHALVIVPEEFADRFKQGDSLPLGTAFAREACWTVFRGSQAGKSFPVSTEAVLVIRGNIDTISNRVRVFNRAHNYTEFMGGGEDVVREWPTPLQG